MGMLQVLVVWFGLLCLVFLMTKVEESVEIGPQTQWEKTIDLCDYGVGLRTILRPIILPFTYAAAFSFWLLQYGSFTWLKVIFHFKLCLLITPLKKTTNTLYGYHNDTAKNRPLDPFIVERKSSYKSMFVLPSGCPLDVNYPAISDSKLSSILPLVAQVPRKLKHLFTTPNLVPVNMMRWFSWSSTTYRAHMFKKKVSSDTWKVCVVIVRDDTECEEAVKSEFSDYDHGQPFEVMFLGDKIVLKSQKEDHNIPLGELVLDGWSITADNTSITKESVDGYCGRGMMPLCQLEVKWDGGDNTELKQQVCLEGAKAPQNVFHLTCSYEAPLCAYVFKKKCSANTWIVNVVVVRDYAKCRKAVNDEFHEAVRPFPVEFRKDSVVLKIRKKGHRNVPIPYPDGLDVDGWNITPDNHPKITKESVKRFPDGAIKPYCQLEVKWNGGDNTELKQLVTLEGARGPQNIFHLVCCYEANPYAYVFKKKQAADKWMVNVVIVRNEKKCQNAVKSEFQGHEEVTVFPVEFEEDQVVLKISEGRSPSVDIPYPEGLDRDGWTITPYSPPEITKESVKQFPDDAIKPYCRLEVKWRGGDNTELKQLVTLEGAKGDKNYFILICSYQGQNQTASHDTSLVCSVFRKKRAANTWIMNVVIVRDDKGCTNAVKSEFQDHEKAVPSFPVNFKDDADKMVLKIRSRREGHPTLQLPYDPDGLVVDGWNITPENPPEITRVRVKRYPQDSDLMPHCQFTVKWNGADRDLEQVMCLEGAEERRDFFHLMCSYQEMRSLCSVFRRKNAEGSTWMMNVVIFRNDKECANAVKSEFQDHEEAVRAFPVRFEKERTVLKICNRDGEKVDIPQPQGLDVDGWNITPTSHPEITKDCVHSYPDSGQKPFCQLEVKWKGGDNSELKERVYLDGAENFFTLICTYQGSTGPGPVVLDKKPQVYELSEVIKRTAANWSELAYALKFDNHDVETIGRNSRNVKDGCTVMLGNWLDGQGKRGPRTWRTLLEALRAIDLTELADELSPP